MRSILTTLSILLSILALSSLALADALVIVEVRTQDGSATDGTVTLAPRGGEGSSHSCTTREGRCRIEGVQGGMYTVSFVPVSGEAPEDRPAVIPPEGRVTLHVAAP